MLLSTQDKQVSTLVEHSKQGYLHYEQLTPKVPDYPYPDLQIH